MVRMRRDQARIHSAILADYEQLMWAAGRSALCKTRRDKVIITLLSHPAITTSLLLSFHVGDVIYDQSGRAVINRRVADTQSSYRLSNAATFTLREYLTDCWRSADEPLINLTYNGLMAALRRLRQRVSEGRQQTLSRRV